jgi:peptidoglycan L-alanyl-D-glutamate endopeptidase CwlK
MAVTPLTQQDIDKVWDVLTTAFHKAANNKDKERIKKKLTDLGRLEALLLIGENVKAAKELASATDSLQDVVDRLSDPSLMLRFNEARNRARQAAGLPPITTQPALEPTPSPAPSPVLAPLPGPAPVLSSPIDPNKRSSDLTRLHPKVRNKVKAIQKQLDDEGIPMKVFEAFREPERQTHLYAKGRTTSGSKVSNARAWQSYHQYGMAADFVRFENGRWNWNTATAQQRAQWDRFHEIAREKGLEPLSWEKPHVQLIGTSLTQLMNGDYPDGGDDSWADSLALAINRWPNNTDPTKPPLPQNEERPQQLHLGGDANEASGEWHNLFGGDHWRFDNRGVYTRNHDGSDKLWRTPGSPITIQEIVAHYRPAISAASSQFDVPESLIVMTIATETGRFRNDKFTGPKTFRWEQGVLLTTTGDPAIDGKEKGDYSAGPMQVLSNTARWMNNTAHLGLDPKTILPWFKNKPAKNPSELGMYDGAKSILIGTAYIAHNLPKTGIDPILVSAAYNAGSLKPSPANHWRIRSTGDHLDRAAEWYGDACSVLNGE